MEKKIVMKDTHSKITAEQAQKEGIRVTIHPSTEKQPIIMDGQFALGSVVEHGTGHQMAFLGGAANLETMLNAYESITDAVVEAIVRFENDEMDKDEAFSALIMAVTEGYAERRAGEISEKMKSNPVEAIQELLKVQARRGKFND